MTYREGKILRFDDFDILSLSVEIHGWYVISPLLCLA